MTQHGSNVRSLTLIFSIMLGVVFFGLAGCGESINEEASMNKETAEKTKKTNQAPSISPDIEEVSRHPSEMPEHANYTLFKGDEYQNPVRRGNESITKEVHFNIEEVEAEIVEGTSRDIWAFNGRVPGPMIRGKAGDVVNFKLHNPESNRFPHNVDFHAVTGPGGGATALDVLPGETSNIQVKLIKPGIYIYHCAFPPIPNHIEHGMYGLIVVEPEQGLPEVDHEYYLFQNEYYTELGGEKSAAQTKNKGKVSADAKTGNLEEPTWVVFNGRPNAITGEHSVGAVEETIQVGDTARFFMGNIGPNFISNFHIIGEMFDNVYVEGSFDLVNHNVQTTLVPAGGAVGVDVTFEVPGTYIPVDHAIYRTQKGALGMIQVEGEENPDIFKPIKNSDIR